MKKYFISENTLKDTKDIVNKLRLISEKYDLEETQEIEEANLLISIGGDGTFLDSSKKIFEKNIEIFGINKGTLGYLTEVKENDLEKILEKYSKNNYSTQERMLLNCEFKKMNVLNKETALNDIVLSKKDSSVIGIDIYIKEKKINSFYADGVIISTPTGSTGYSLSCGGPIIDPISEMIIITPIAPHSMINRSIILHPTDIRIQLTDTKGKGIARLAIDGQIEEILEGSFIKINKSENSLKVVTFNENNFLDKIKENFS